MEVTIQTQLQKTVSYSLVYFLVGLLVATLAAFFISLAVWRFRMILAGKASRKKAVKPPKIVLAVIKTKYKGQMRRLIDGLNTDALEERVAYQELSRIIRQFVHESTLLDVQNYSYTEIRDLNMPQLTKLVGEYYAPEFAREADSDLSGALQRTMQVIHSWQ